MRGWVAAAAALALAGAASAQQSPEALRKAVLEKDAAEIAALLPGRWDNDLQVFFAKDAGETPGARTHVFAKPAEGGGFTVAIGPAFDQIARTETWALAPDVAAGGVRVTVSPACALLLRRDGDQFAGTPASGCARAGEPARLTLGATTMTLALKGGETLRLKKARPFLCWAAVLRGAKHGDSGEGQNNWFFARDIWVHDQGGVMVVKTDETPAREIRVRLRRAEWPSGANRPSLTLYVLADGSDRAVSYAWGEADATRLGINLRWIQVSCTAAPERISP